MKKVTFISIIAMVAIVFNGCEKDDTSPNSNNQTNGKTTAVFNPNKIYGTLTDQDGNVYKTITIGTQTWMAENLRTTKYRDGSAIPEVTENETWGSLSTGAYCYYNNTKNIDTIATFGKLYNWHAVSDSRNLAPTGWHVATDAEWTQLTDYLGGSKVCGGMLTETGSAHWSNPNAKATNETGFTALPGGARGNKGIFEIMGLYGYLWTATESDADNAWYRYTGGDDNVYRSNWGNGNKVVGFSVRCIMD